MWSCGGNQYGQLGIGTVPRMMAACCGFLKLLPHPQVRWRHLRRSSRKQLSRPQRMLRETQSQRPRIVDFALLGGSASRTRGTHGIEAVEGLEQGASGSLRSLASQKARRICSGLAESPRCGAHHVICLTRPPGTERASTAALRVSGTSQVTTEGWSGREILGWEELATTHASLRVSGGALLLEGSAHLGARPTSCKACQLVHRTVAVVES